MSTKSVAIHTDQLVEIHRADKWFNIPLDLLGIGGALAPKGDLTLQFGEGTYVAMMQGKSAAGIVSGSTLSIKNEIVYDYDQVTTFTGSVSGDAVLDESTILLKVGNQAIEPGQSTVVQGQFGTLTINADGTYTYDLVKPVDASEDWKPPYGQVDSFQLVSQDVAGKTVIDSLNIKIGTHTAEDDFNTVSVNVNNEKSTIEFHDRDVLLENYGKSVSKSFEIKENQIGQNFKIEVKTSSDSVVIIGKKDVTVGYVLKNTTTNQEWVFTAPIGKDVILSHNVQNLPAGNYQLTITSVDGTIEKVDIVTDVISLDKYSNDVVTPVIGQLLENDKGKDQLDILSLGNKDLYVGTANSSKGANSISIEGNYGTLVVLKDGSYTYTAKGGIYGTDTFTYVTTSKVGTQETATLEINVGKNITASAWSDIAVSSSANDTFMMGAGADTVIYTNLIDDRGGNGGNGLDKWSDFNVEEGDKIDLLQLLDGRQTEGNIGNYLKYEDGVLFVDRNGESNFEALLEVEATDMNALLQGITWQVEGVMALSEMVDLSNIESLSLDDTEDSKLFALTLDDVISTDKENGITFFIEEEEEQSFVVTSENDAMQVNSNSVDTQAVVDPLDDLLDQKTTMI